jgi:hypothetical protein
LLVMNVHRFFFGYQLIFFPSWQVDVTCGQC